MFVTIHTAVYPHELYPLKSILEQEGVFVMIKDEMTLTAHPFISHAVGGAKLQVHEDDVEAAVAILEDQVFPPEDLDRAYEKEEEVLRLKKFFRSCEKLENVEFDLDDLQVAYLSKEEVESLLSDELEYRMEKVPEPFNFKTWLLEIFVKKDDDRRELQSRYHLEQDLIDHETKQSSLLKSVKCPRCGSKNTIESTQPETKRGFLSVLIYTLFGPPIPFGKKVIHCFDCLEDFDVDATIHVDE